jgi:hypothetical protein
VSAPIPAPGSPSGEAQVIGRLRDANRRLERRVQKLQATLRSVLDISIREYGNEQHVDVQEILRTGDLTTLVPVVVDELRRLRTNDHRWQAHTLAHREQDQLLERLYELVARHAHTAQLIADVGRVLLPPAEESEED